MAVFRFATFFAGLRFAGARFAVFRFATFFAGLRFATFRFFAAIINSIINLYSTFPTSKNFLEVVDTKQRIAKKSFEKSNDEKNQ